MQITKLYNWAAYSIYLGGDTGHAILLSKGKRDYTSGEYSHYTEGIFKVDLAPSDRYGRGLLVVCPNIAEP